MGGGGGGDNVRWNIHTYSMLHVFQGRRASGGVGWVGVVEVITFVGTFTHIPCYMFSRDAGHLVGWVGWGWWR